MRRILSIFGTALVVSSTTLQAVEKVRTLTLAEAQALALKRHPRIGAAEFALIASKQQFLEARAAYLPQVSTNVGAVVDSALNTRIISGVLPVSATPNRASAAVLVSQLITDFGRTTNLMSSTRLKSQADQQNVEAAKAQILLEVDGAYLSVLQAQSVMRVAEETTKARGVVRDQINALAEHQMKSSLDVGFALANYKEAQLLLSRSRNDLQSAYATLAALIEEPDVAAFALTSQPSPGELPADVSSLIRAALQNRPDLLRLRLEHDSAAKFAKAERALRNPTLSMQGAAGVAPWHDSTLNEDYAAAGVALTWQLYTGGLYTARQKEAEARAGQTDEVVRDLEINIARDVRIAWLNANNSLEQMSLTVELRQQADENMKLAQARYDTGSSSIVELSDAQLGLTSAQINETDAKYLYLVRRAALDYQIGVIERRH